METFKGYTGDQIRAMPSGVFQDFLDGLSPAEKQELVGFLGRNPEAPVQPVLNPTPVEAVLGGVGEAVVETVSGWVNPVLNGVLVVGGTVVLTGLGAAMIMAGLLSLLGFNAGDVAKLSPPGRAAALAEVALK